MSAIIPQGRIVRLLRQYREEVCFCLRFSAYTIVAFLALYALHDQVVVPFTRHIAWLTHRLLRAAGAQAWVSGVYVGIPGFAVEITNNCHAV